MIRRGVIALLTLATLAWSALWIDSYRPRADVSNLRAELAALVAERAHLRREPQSGLAAARRWYAEEMELIRAYNFTHDDYRRAHLSGCAPATWEIGRDTRTFAVRIFRRCAGLEGPIARAIAPGTLTFQVAPSLRFRWTVLSVDIDRRFAGFRFARQTVSPWGRTRTGTAYRLRVPPWAVFLILAAYPTISFVRERVRRWYRRQRGRCVKCGYDLTGNVSGACPECGTAIVMRRTGRNVRAGQSPRGL
jgi:predicted RNA-binding Zn-ribbon protein involved in translation (DUF1610 family)